ncbi:tyrosine-type recombinase/integrase [Microbacterium sp. 1P10UB]|uniref:tyrosine-type recombinase/integrase n=1 Tax=unclassified Microbacterium TaxID=2609290 RepID=UPI0039A3327B
MSGSGLFGRVTGGNEPPFFVLVDDDGEPVGEVTSSLLDFWARGNAELSCRSYAYGLLRWYRFLALEGVVWDRASRDVVRDFVLACRQASVLCPRPLVARTINHNLAVVSAFYAFQISQQQGPLLNPVPTSHGGRQGKRSAHHNPETSFRLDRRADLRQKVPETAPRSLPEQKISELLRLLEHPRDRALMEFYLSSAVRPAELLGMSVEDVDPGSQLITVVRKGTRARQRVPASSIAFVWLRIYQESLPPNLLAAGQPVWWTRRRPFKPLNYDAARALMRRLGAVLGTPVKLHDLRHTAAARMAQDQAMSLPDIQRVLGHAHLSTTQQYIRQHDVDVLTRVAEHLRTRAEPTPPPATPLLRYSSADLTELMGDSAW